MGTTTAAYTKKALLAFLDKAESTGLYKRNTVGGLRQAATTLLEDLADTDDVRRVNAEQAAQRYHNKHPSKLSTGSLREYKYRLERVLKEFAAFNENPAGYRPKGRITQTGGKKEGGARPKRPPKEYAVHAADGLLVAGSDSVSAIATVVPMLRLSYPIRDDVLAEVAVPRGMTTEEAKRLCAFITTLAKDYQPKD